MPSAKQKVFFTNLRTTPTSNLIDKTVRLAKAAGIEKLDFKNKFVAIKIHFGEPGNLSYLRPNYAAAVADLLRGLGAKPFLTDSNTLYSGRRANAVDHLQSAMENGYNPISARCAVIIADGVKGTDFREIALPDAKFCKAPKIGAAIADADIVISMSHFKGHEQTGFGGALKNLGMGAASVGGKLELHASSKPVVSRENCVGCGICVRSCRHGAAALDAKRKAAIDAAKCVGCGQCIALCQFDAAHLAEFDSSERLNFKIAEYTKAVLLGKPHFHFNFVIDVSPECDCWNHNDAPVVPSLGIAASFDPVALDQFCADLVCAAPVIPNTALAEKAAKIAARTSPAKKHAACACGSADHFKAMHPDTDWQTGLAYAEEIGLGVRAYERVDI